MWLLHARGRGVLPRICLRYTTSCMGAQGYAHPWYCAGIPTVGLPGLKDQEQEEGALAFACTRHRAGREQKTARGTAGERTTLGEPAKGQRLPLVMASSKHSLASRRARAARLTEDMRMPSPASQAVGTSNSPVAPHAVAPPPSGPPSTPFSRPADSVPPHSPLPPPSLSLRPSRVMGKESNATHELPVSAPMSPYAAIGVHSPPSPFRRSHAQVTGLTSQVTSLKLQVTGLKSQVRGAGAAGSSSLATRAPDLANHSGAFPGTEAGRQLEGGTGSTAAGITHPSFTSKRGMKEGATLLQGGNTQGTPSVRGLFDAGTMADHISTALSRGLTRDWSAPAGTPAVTPTLTPTLTPTRKPTLETTLASTLTTTTTPALKSTPTLTPTSAPQGHPAGTPVGIPGAMPSTLARTGAGSVPGSGAGHTAAMSRLEEFIPSAAEKGQNRGKGRGVKAKREQGQGKRAKGSNSPKAPTTQTPKPPFPLGMRFTPCRSVILPRQAGASGVPSWAVQEGYREVEISTSRNLSPKVALVAEARASRLALGDVRIRVQRIGSLPWRIRQGVSMSGEPVNSVTDAAVRNEVARRLAVADEIVMNSAGAALSTTGEVTNSTGATLTTVRAASVQDSAQATGTFSAPHSPAPPSRHASYPLPHSLLLRSPSPYSPPSLSPSPAHSPEVPCSLSASFLTDLQHRASLTVLACAGRVEADSLSLLLSSSSTRPLTGWYTPGRQQNNTGGSRVSHARGYPGLNTSARPQPSPEGRTVFTTAAVASSHVVSSRTRLCTRITTEFVGPRGARPGWGSQGAAGATTIGHPGPARGIGASKVFLQALHKVSPGTAMSAALSYKLGGPADLGLILQTGARTVGAESGAGAKAKKIGWGLRSLLGALGFRAKAFVNTHGVFSVSFNVSGGDASAFDAAAEEHW